jgi:hypothetical protein
MIQVFQEVAFFEILHGIANVACFFIPAKGFDETARILFSLV